MSKRMETLLELHQASAHLQAAFIRSVNKGDTEIAEQIRLSALQVNVSIRLLVATGIAEVPSA